MVRISKYTEKVMDILTSISNCLFCGERSSTNKNKNKGQSALIETWDDECISVLISILFHSADETHKKAVEDVLRSSSYCESCKCDLRDLSLTHKIISNERQRMATLVEKMIHNVSIHLATTTSHSRKSRRMGEALSVLFEELQEEDWTLQTFEYIKSAVLRSFVESPISNNQSSCGEREETTEMNDDDYASESKSFIVVKEELDMTGLDIELDSSSDCCNLLGVELDPFEEPNLEDKVKDKSQDDDDSIKNSKLKAEIDLKNVKKGRCSDDELSDSDYFNPEASEDSDEAYEPPASKTRRFTKARNSSEIPAPKSKATHSSSKKPLRKKRKPGVSTEKTDTNLVELPVKCKEKECCKRFCSETRMNAHFIRFHRGDRKTPYRCTFCNRDGEAKNDEKIVGFKTIQQLQRHITNVHKTSLPSENVPRHKCSYCGKCLRSANELSVHVAAKHEKKSFEGACSICSKRFETTEEMEAHKLKIHQGKYPFTCEDCDKIFADGIALRFHVKQLHSLKDRVTCKLCKDKSFVSKYRLQFHEYQHHPELKGKKFHCELCDITFKNYYYYRDHRIGVHRELVKAPVHKCVDCNTIYKRRNQLKSHQLRMHNPDRPKKYKCSLCPEAFKAVCSLKNHEESVHSGLKYFCYVCGSQFTSQSHILLHMKTIHAEGKDYVRKRTRPRRTKRELLGLQLTQSESTNKPVSDQTTPDDQLSTTGGNINISKTASLTSEEIQPSDP